MKSNKLLIKINKPIKEVFFFTLNPNNTPLWIDSIVKEKVNEQPTKLGTVYKNVNSEGEWSEYIVTAFEKNKMFEMTSKNKNYHVRYIFRPINGDTTELEYYEWVVKGELEKPFTLDILKKLKRIVEE